MERRDIEIFLVLAEELHFGRTAERLHVSTTRVSQTIRKLERRIGAALFERTSRRVELTRAGAELLEGMRAPLEQLEAVLERADLLVVGAPHRVYTELRPSQPVVDIWDLFGRGVRV